MYETCNFVSVELESYEEAQSNEVWVKAMEEEMRMIEKNQTWELTDYPQGKNVIDVKWIYKIKFKADGSIQKHKARLVARGFTQKPGINFS